MCRNITRLYNLDPPVEDTEIRDAAMQFVRKISGFNKPSQVNEAAFNAAIEQITAISIELLENLKTKSPPQSRAVIAEKKRQQSLKRFSKQ